jgi:thiol-disulfide isomerase/thioredoxin
VSTGARSAPTARPVSRVRTGARHAPIARLALALLLALALPGPAGMAAVDERPLEALLAELRLAPLAGAAPPLALEDLDGRLVSLDNLRGQVVLLYFWATWCPYCERELPAAIAELELKLASKPLRVLAVDIAEPRDKVAAFVRGRRLGSRVLLDLDGSVAEAYRVNATPTVVLIGRDGQLVARGIGNRPWSSEPALALLQRLLAPPAR